MHADRSTLHDLRTFATRLTASTRIVALSMSMPHEAHDASSLPRSLGALIAISLRTELPLRASSNIGALEREIWLAGGEVIHARHGLREGLAAVFAFLDETDLEFTIDIGRAAARRTVTMSWRRLCHEARCALLDAGPEAKVAESTEIWFEIAVDDLGGSRSIATARYSGV